MKKEQKQIKENQGSEDKTPTKGRGEKAAQEQKDNRGPQKRTKKEKAGATKT